MARGRVGTHLQRLSELFACYSFTRLVQKYQRFGTPWLSRMRYDAQLALSEWIEKQKTLKESLETFLENKSRMRQAIADGGRIQLSTDEDEDE